MKWLIFFFLVTACGQHIEPSGKDIRDRDGDQIVDGDEEGINKYIANISPLENVQMIVKLKGHNGPGVNFENGIDVVKYSRDLMLKNAVSIPKDDYFSEWSKLIIKEGSFPEAREDYKYILKLSFNNLEQAPSKLNLRDKDKVVQSFDWQPEMEIALTKEQYIKVRNNTLSFSLARLETINSAFRISQQDSVKENTYRVLINNGETTQIFYVANEHEFEDFLKELKIYDVFDINEVNLLTTSHDHSLSQWWVRTLNGKDKVLLKDDLKNISDYRLQNFHKNTINMGRTNGHSVGQIKIQKSPSAAIMLKIRGEQQKRSFSKRYETKIVGRLAREGYRIKYEIVDIHPFPAETLNTQEILKSIQIDGMPLDQEKDLAMSLQNGTDKQGPYLEMILETEKTDFILNVPSLSAATYQATGKVREKIGHGKWVNFPGTASNPEGYLNLLIDAYTEKL
jgi:hypothetical protein